jgi:hypothetical protein
MVSYTLTVNGYRLMMSILSPRPIDNPFIDENYVEGLRRCHHRSVSGLLDGDWNYLDEDNSLFTMAIIDKMTVYAIPEEEDESLKSISELTHQMPVKIQLLLRC